MCAKNCPTVYSFWVEVRETFKHIKGQVGEAPINQIKYGGRALSSMPRWTDAILLNVKAPLSKAEEDHLASVANIYGIVY